MTLSCIQILQFNMTVEELLQHPIFTLPKDWRDSTDADYYHFVNTTIGSYLDLLQSLEPIVIDNRAEYQGPLGTISNKEIVFKAVRELRIGIIQSLQAHSNQGSPSKAIAKLARHIDLPAKHQLYSPAVHLSRLILRANTLLYRLRHADLPLHAREMFHIPYEKRYLVTPQRFSIAGQPCIYAASSVYLAFKEIRAATFGLTLHAVKLRSNVASQFAPVVLIDLRNRVEEMRARYLGRPHRYDGELIKFLVTWPLIMATSIPTRPTDSFHEEYVIPHLILEWVRSHQHNAVRVDGIAFSSSRVAHDDPAYLNAYNVVIPVHHWENEGLCPVRTSQFQISAPITRAMLPDEMTANMPAEKVAGLLQQALQEQDFMELHPTKE